MKLHESFADGQFSHPATEEQITEVEEILSVKFPTQLKELLFECDGFRENLGNAKYLLSLTNEDFIGSILRTTLLWWNEVTIVDLKPFIFFGYSSADEAWGIRVETPHDIIAYHYNMGGKYEKIGNSILSIYQNDYKLYDE